MPSSVARPAVRKVRVGALLAGLLALVLAGPAAANAPAADTEAAAFEVEYLEMMIDHHAMGVHMAEMCVEKAEHGQLVALCEEIMSTQAAEIETMQEWLADWYGIDHEPSMDDMAHHMQMEELAGLSGEDFEIAFLHMMSEHHVMAVVDSRECLREAEHTALRRLCASIMSSQLQDIAQMQAWLCRWYGECGFDHLGAA